MLRTVSHRTTIQSTSLGLYRHVNEKRWFFQTMQTINQPNHVAMTSEITWSRGYQTS